MLSPSVSKYICALALLSAATNCHSQLTPLWTQSIETGFSSYFSDRTKLLRDANGDLLVIGNTVTSANDSDWIVLKYNDLGDLLWTFTWDGPFQGVDRVNDATMDATGNLILVGTGKMDSTDLDLTVVRITANGTLDWQYMHDGGAGATD
jgi:hypothetical protein